MNALETLTADAKEKLGDFDENGSATYVGYDGRPSYSRVGNRELTIEVKDGDNLLTIVLDPSNPTDNIAFLDNLKTNNHTEIEPDRIATMAEYMLGFMVSC